MKYKETLDNSLLQINPQHEALRCRDLNCNKHREYMKELYNTIIDVCSKLSKKCLPHTSQKKENKVVPGWNEHVKEHSERAKMWHEIWVQSGRPRDGHIAGIRRKTIIQYHYAIRYVVKENISLRNNKIGEAVADNND